MSAAEPAIRTAALSRHYRSGDATLVIFDQLDLEVAEGERLALVGESGAGKSSLLHLLGGLDRPTSGKIYFGSKEITSLGDADLADFRNREIGYVWQSHYLLPEFTAIENVMMPLLIRGESSAVASAAARERLDQVGLGGRTSHRAGELSGGEQQRVALARALAGNPRFLFADEPTGSLDYATGERIADLLDHLHRENRLTSIFVTHNVGFAGRCDRILKLDRGSLHPLPVAADLQRGGEASNPASGTDGTNYV